MGKTLTDFASGVGTGIDKGLKVEVSLSEKVTSLGLSRTVAKAVRLPEQKQGLTVYIKSKRPVAAALIARAMDAEGEEIGRATVDVEFAAEDAKYVTFPFQPEMDTQLVRSYVVDLRPPDAPKSTEPRAERQE